MTDHAAVVPAGAAEGADMQVMKDLGKAEQMVKSGEWQYVDGSHRDGVMRTYRSGCPTWEYSLVV